MGDVVSISLPRQDDRWRDDWSVFQDLLVTIRKDRLLASIFSITLYRFTSCFVLELHTP